MSMPSNEAYDFVEEMVTNNFQYPYEKINPRKVTKIYKSDALSI